MLTYIMIPDAPPPKSPYSHAVKCGDLLFVAGQTGHDPKTGELAGETVTEHAEQAMKNLEAILTASGVGFAQVVKTTCFLVNIEDIIAFNEVYARYFKEKPARSCFAVKELPRKTLCEVELIASLK
jgi:2-iminobutanoate/2-iminopropanoate deaminase